MSTEKFTRSDCATLSTLVVVIVYAILNLACGGAHSQTQQEQSQGEFAEPPTEGTEGAESGAVQDPDLISYVSDKGGVEMSVVMQQHVIEGAERDIPTDGVVSSDWTIANFSFEGGQLQVAPDYYRRERILLAMQHRYHDAELVAWFEPEDAALSTRYLDTRADDLITRLGEAATLLDLAEVPNIPPSTPPQLRALQFDTGTLGGLDALSVQLIRVHPLRRNLQTLHIILKRQYVDDQPVLVIFALAARRDDFDELLPELQDLADSAQLLGSPVESALNPNRVLGPAGDEYDYDWEQGTAAPRNSSPANDPGLKTLRSGVNQGMAVLQNLAREHQQQEEEEEGGWLAP